MVLESRPVVLDLEPTAPLASVCRYVKWVQADESTAKSKVELQKALEDCTSALQPHVALFKDNPLYLRLWVQYVSFEYGFDACSWTVTPFLSALPPRTSLACLHRRTAYRIRQTCSYSYG